MNLKCKAMQTMQKETRNRTKKTKEKKGNAEEGIVGNIHACLSKTYNNNSTKWRRKQQNTTVKFRHHIYDIISLEDKLYKLINVCHKF